MSGPKAQRTAKAPAPSATLAADAGLAPCILFRATVGSRAWGLASPDSDLDQRGVFLWPLSWSARLQDSHAVWVQAEGSTTYWEWERCIRQALRADPNTMEMLWVPEVEFMDELGEELRARRELFVSQRIYGAFGRYALAQSKKLRQSLRLAEHRRLVLGWIQTDAQASLDQVAARLAAQALEDTSEAGLLRAKDYLKQLYRSLFDKGEIEACSFGALRSLASTPGCAALTLPRELRPKNAYNLLRIVSCAVQWLETGVPLIEVDGELKERLLKIKAGKVPLRQTLAWTEESAADLERAHARSRLPREPDLAAAQALLLRGRELAAQRWFASAGPWSKGEAPTPPAAPSTSGRGEARRS